MRQPETTERLFRELFGLGTDGSEQGSSMARGSAPDVVNARSPVFAGGTVLHGAIADGASSVWSQNAVRLCAYFVDTLHLDPDAVNSFGVSARDTAVSSQAAEIRQWVHTLGALFGRYKAKKGPPVHRSHTCTVVFAKDVVDREKVALKLMSDKGNFLREVGVRKEHTLDSARVMQILRVHETPEQLCIVMPRADRSLFEVVASERLAGLEFFRVLEIARDVALAIAHLHENGLCHADIKPRNVVRVGQKFLLIDLDATVPLDNRFQTRGCRLRMPPRSGCSQPRRGYRNAREHPVRRRATAAKRPMLGMTCGATVCSCSSS